MYFHMNDQEHLIQRTIPVEKQRNSSTGLCLPSVENITQDLVYSAFHSASMGETLSDIFEQDI